MPFQLPDYIENTGISKIRSKMKEKDMGKALKQKMRERLNPKLGKMDIDYQILFDAFFKFQRPPKMTNFGEIYREGKENEVKMRAYRPGKISEELRIALGMPENSPPPWIINMQRFGLPPSYPNIKIPGLNANLQEEQNWSMEEFDQDNNYDKKYDIKHWGDPESDEQEVEEEEQSEEEEYEQDISFKAGLFMQQSYTYELGYQSGVNSGYNSSGFKSGMLSGKGMVSVTGMETPAAIELMKKQ